MVFDVLCWGRSSSEGRLLGTSVLGDGLGALRDGVLGELSGEEEADGSLDLAAGDGGLLVVLGKLGCLSSNALEDVVDERVHDAHGLGGDAGVGVNLLEHLEDVHGVRLLALLVVLLGGASGSSLDSLAGLLVAFLRNLRGHVDRVGKWRAHRRLKYLNICETQTS